MAKRKLKVTFMPDMVFDADAEPQARDWPKRSWDLPPPGSPVLEGMRQDGPIRPAFPDAVDGKAVTSRRRRLRP